MLQFDRSATTSTIVTVIRNVLFGIGFGLFVFLASIGARQADDQAAITGQRQTDGLAITTTVTRAEPLRATAAEADVLQPVPINQSSSANGDKAPDTQPKPNSSSAHQTSKAPVKVKVHPEQSEVTLRRVPKHAKQNKHKKQNSKPDTPAKHVKLPPQAKAHHNK